MCPSCQKSKRSVQYEEAVAIAKIESKGGKAVVYEYSGKFYGEKYECWNKGGRVGRLIALVYPL